MVHFPRGTEAQDQNYFRPPGPPKGFDSPVTLAYNSSPTAYADHGGNSSAHRRCWAVGRFGSRAPWTICRAREYRSTSYGPSIFYLQEIWSTPEKGFNLDPLAGRRRRLRAPSRERRLASCPCGDSEVWADAALGTIKRGRIVAKWGFYRGPGLKAGTIF